MEYIEEDNHAGGRIPDFGAIFMSNIATKNECFKRKVLALPRSMENFVRQVKSGTALFLFEYEKRELFGVFRASSDGSMNIVPHAFQKRFPAQVRFRLMWKCQPLSEVEFGDAIRDNYYSPRKFNFGLSKDQVHRLLRLFSSRIVENKLPLQVRTRMVNTGVGRNTTMVDDDNFASSDDGDLELAASYGYHGNLLPGAKETDLVRDRVGTKDTDISMEHGCYGDEYLDRRTENDERPIRNYMMPEYRAYDDRDSLLTFCFNNNQETSLERLRKNQEIYDGRYITGLRENNEFQVDSELDPAFMSSDYSDDNIDLTRNQLVSTGLMGTLELATDEDRSILDSCTAREYNNHTILRPREDRKDYVDGPENGPEYFHHLMYKIREDDRFIRNEGVGRKSMLGNTLSRGHRSIDEENILMKKRRLNLDISDTLASREKCTEYNPEFSGLIPNQYGSTPNANSVPDITLSRFAVTRNFGTSGLSFHDATSKRTLPYIPELPTNSHCDPSTLAVDCNSGLVREIGGIPYCLLRGKTPEYCFESNNPGKSLGFASEYGNKASIPNTSSHPSSDFSNFQHSSAVPSTGGELGEKGWYRSSNSGENPYLLDRSTKTSAGKCKDIHQHGIDRASSCKGFSCSSEDIYNPEKESVIYSSGYLKISGRNVTNNKEEYKTSEVPHSGFNKNRRSVFSRLKSGEKIQRQERDDDNRVIYDEASVDEVMDILCRGHDVVMKKSKKCKSVGEKRNDGGVMDLAGQTSSVPANVEINLSTITKKNDINRVVEEGNDKIPKETRVVDFKRRSQTRNSLFKTGIESVAEEITGLSRKEVERSESKLCKRRKLVRPVFNKSESCMAGNFLSHLPVCGDDADKPKAKAVNSGLLLPKILGEENKRVDALEEGEIKDEKLPASQVPDSGDYHVKSRETGSRAHAVDAVKPDLLLIETVDEEDKGVNALMGDNKLFSSQVPVAGDHSVETHENAEAKGVGADLFPVKTLVEGNSRENAVAKGVNPYLVPANKTLAENNSMGSHENAEAKGVNPILLSAKTLAEEDAGVNNIPEADMISDKTTLGSMLFNGTCYTDTNESSTCDFQKDSEAPSHEPKQEGNEASGFNVRAGFLLKETSQCPEDCSDLPVYVEGVGAPLCSTKGGAKTSNLLENEKISGLCGEVESFQDNRPKLVRPMFKKDESNRSMIHNLALQLPNQSFDEGNTIRSFDKAVTKLKTKRTNRELLLPGQVCGEDGVGRNSEEDVDARQVEIMEQETMLISVRSSPNYVNCGFNTKGISALEAQKVLASPTSNESEKRKETTQMDSSEFLPKETFQNIDHGSTIQIYSGCVHNCS